MYEAVTLYCRASHPVPLRVNVITSQSYNPRYAVTCLVWALSLSLATTQEIIVIFSSSAYLDVSVRQVRSYCDMSSTCRVSPLGNLRIKSHLQIPEAYRSLSRPSSPPRAKASPVYSFLLSSTYAPFAPHSVLFDMLIATSSNQRLYCCLLFFLTSSNMSKIFLPDKNRDKWRITESNR